MSKKIFNRLMKGLRQARAYLVTGDTSEKSRTHYFAMNPATGKMVRKTVSHPRVRGKRKKSSR